MCVIACTSSTGEQQRIQLVIMKNAIVSFAALFLLSLVSVQTAFGEMLPPEEGAVPIGFFTASLSFEDMGPSLKFSEKGNKFGIIDNDNGGGIIETIAWMVSSGETVYTLDLNTAEFFMPCGWAKQIAVSAMVDMFAQAAIQRGMELGFTHCGSTCGENISKVYYASCVERNNGPDCPTLTAAPGSSYSMNAYDVCCETGFPMTTFLYSVCGQTDCSSGFMPTCGV